MIVAELVEALAAVEQGAAVVLHLELDGGGFDLVGPCSGVNPCVGRLGHGREGVPQGPNVVVLWGIEP